MIDWLLGTLLATSALIVLVLLVREPVRRHFGARVAYGLWLIPVARLLMPTMTHRSSGRSAITPRTLTSSYGRADAAQQCRSAGAIVDRADGRLADDLARALAGSGGWPVRGPNERIPPRAL